MVVWLTNAPHRLRHLDTWPLLVALFGELAAALLEEMHHWRWALRIYSSIPLPVPSLLPAWVKM